MPDNSVKILIVEDEMVIAAKISMFLSELGYEVSGILPRAEEAMLHIQENRPDIILLDIQLKGAMDGIDLALEIQKTNEVPVIFLTANTDEASFNRAKMANPYAFLAKPFKKMDLQRSLELTIRRMEDTYHGLDSEPPTPAEVGTFILEDRIFVRIKEKMVKILFASILYIEAERNYCRIITDYKEYLLTMPMKSLEDKLPVYFQRIHRSHIVNLKQINEVEESSILVGLKWLPLSKSLRAELLSRLRTT